jgi:hypothetical protein
MKKTQIYLVENCLNDPHAIYIGKTKNTREPAHKRTFGKNIKYTIIDEICSLNKKDWKPLECYWIEQFKIWGFKVLNKNKGGGGPSYVPKHIRKKISDSNKGKTMNQKTKIKISKAKKGCKVWSEGKKFSTEHKEKISKNTKGKSKSSFSYINNKNNIKPIIQYDLDNNFIKEWKSAVEAAKFYKAYPNSIRNCCNGKTKTSCGFIWKNKNK